MTQKLYTLSEDDVRVLRGVVERERNRVQNTQGRTLLDQPDLGCNGGFLALVPDGGIAARSSDTVTAVECSVYRQVDGELVDSGAVRTVYNPTDSAVDAGYALIKQDQFGTWWAHATPVAGTSVQRFVRADPLYVSNLSTDVTAGSGVTITMSNSITGLVVGSKVHLSTEQENGSDGVVTVLTTPTSTTFTCDTVFDITKGSRAALLNSTGLYMYGQLYEPDGAGVLALTGETCWIMTGSTSRRHVRSTRRDFSELFPAGTPVGPFDGRDLYLVQQTSRIVFSNSPGTIIAIGPDFFFGSVDNTVVFAGNDFAQHIIDLSSP